MTISLSDIRDRLSPVERAVLDASMLEHASGEWLRAMLQAFFAPLRRTRSPRTALHLLGPWAPQKANPSSLEITFMFAGGRQETMTYDEAQRRWPGFDALARDDVRRAWHREHARKIVRSPAPA